RGPRPAPPVSAAVLRAPGPHRRARAAPRRRARPCRAPALFLGARGLLDVRARSRSREGAVWSLDGRTGRARAGRRVGLSRSREPARGRDRSLERAAHDLAGWAAWRLSAPRWEAVVE